MRAFAKLVRQTVFVALLAVLLGLTAGCAAVGAVLDDLLGEEEAERVPATVERVVDGDTVEVSPGVDGIESVRLIGIDTPEPYASETPEPLAVEASDFARENLEGELVTLEFDAERVDSYGRLLAYVFTPEGELFNETLLLEGYAQVATFPPNTRYLERFEAAQDEAREAERGIWGLPEDEACLLRDRGNGLGGGC